MSRSLEIKIDLTVADDAGDFAIADMIFDLLVSDPLVANSRSIESVDGTMPKRAS